MGTADRDCESQHHSHMPTKAPAPLRTTMPTQRPITPFGQENAGLFGHVFIDAGAAALFSKRGFLSRF
jgi:hypothetical protein